MKLPKYFLVVVFLLLAPNKLQADDLLGKLSKQPTEQLAGRAVEHGNAASGKLIFQREKLGCAKCHVTATDSQQKPIGPAQLAQPRVCAAHITSVNFDNHDWVHQSLGSRLFAPFNARLSSLTLRAPESFSSEHGI